MRSLASGANICISFTRPSSTAGPGAEVCQGLSLPGRRRRAGSSRGPRLSARVGMSSIPFRLDHVLTGHPDSQPVFTVPRRNPHSPETQGRNSRRGDVSQGCPGFGLGADRMKIWTHPSLAYLQPLESTSFPLGQSPVVRLSSPCLCPVPSLVPSTSEFGGPAT